MKVKVHCKQKDGWSKILLLDPSELKSEYLIVPFKALAPGGSVSDSAPFFLPTGDCYYSKRFRFVRETIVRDLVRGTQTTELWAEEE